LVNADAGPLRAQLACARPCVGSPSGSLLLAGGGELGVEIFERFVALAGGPDAHIVVIPTASSEETFGPTWPGLLPLWAAGANRITILHTRDPSVANSEAFVEPLRTAQGVWIPGGRQGRLVDAYLGTRTLEEIHGVLARGGVVGGSSAGASILASYLVRGDPATNEVLMVPGYEEGFALLRDVAVDQHLITRERVMDMPTILTHHPELLGIGLDEGTAIVVRGDLAEVIGRSQVAIYDPTDIRHIFVWMHAGDVYDLGARSFDANLEEAMGGAFPGG